MTGFAEAPQMPFGTELDRVGHLLGGSRVLKRSLGTAFDAHDMLLEGLPGDALNQLEQSL